MFLFRSSALTLCVELSSELNKLPLTVEDSIFAFLEEIVNPVNLSKRGSQHKKFDDSD